jgi:hypothetical protein
MHQVFNNFYGLFCRRDLGPRGPKKGEDHWEEKCPLILVVFNFAIPSALHLMTYIYALYLFRVKDIEQLPTLMERVCSYSAENSCYFFANI